MSDMRVRRKANPFSPETRSKLAKARLERLLEEKRQRFRLAVMQAAESGRLCDRVHFEDLISWAWKTYRFSRSDAGQIIQDVLNDQRRRSIGGAQ